MSVGIFSHLFSPFPFCLQTHKPFNTWEWRVKSERTFSLLYPYDTRWRFVLYPFERRLEICGITSQCLRYAVSFTQADLSLLHRNPTWRISFGFQTQYFFSQIQYQVLVSGWCLTSCRNFAFCSRSITASTLAQRVEGMSNDDSMKVLPSDNGM